MCFTVVFFKIETFAVFCDHATFLCYVYICSQLCYTHLAHTAKPGDDSCVISADRKLINTVVYPGTIHVPTLVTESPEVFFRSRGVRKGTYRESLTSLL